MILDRHLIAKGLMGSLEVVLNQPLGKPLVEDATIRSHIAQGNKFIIEGAVESLVKGIVGGSMRSGEILRNDQSGCRLPKMKITNKGGTYLFTYL